MALILNIETATDVCSIALGKDGAVISSQEIYRKNSHAESINGMIQEALNETSLKLRQIEAVSVSMGPGSYTGLRIGTSSAKGFCFGLDIPLIGVDTLMALANGALIKGYTTDLYCPMIDARRMEVYTALYNRELDLKKPVHAAIIDEGSFQLLLEDNKILFCGNGAEKCKDVIHHPNALFSDDIICSAANMCAISEELYQYGAFKNIAYFTPFYLKEFIAKKKSKTF